MTSQAVIIAAGLTCPLGKTFKSTITAYAAGRRRFRRERSLINIDGQPSTIACVIPPAEERNFERRLIALFEMAFQDCLTQSPSLRSARAGYVRLVLVLPRWLANHQARERLDEMLQAPPYNRFGETQFCFGDHVEAIAAIERVSRDIISGHTDAAFVAALDSYMEPFVLDILAANRILFSRSQPHGIIPGEACAVLLIGKSSLRQPGSAEIIGFGTSDATASDTSPAVGIGGSGLRDALRALATSLGSSTPPSRTMADLNGERWRAEHYGYGIAAFGDRLGSTLLDPECHALAVGDVGAATGGVMAALALGPKPSRRDDPPGSEPIKFPTLILATSKRQPCRALMLAHAREETA